MNTKHGDISCPICAYVAASNAPDHCSECGASLRYVATSQNRFVIHLKQARIVATCLLLGLISSSACMITYILLESSRHQRDEQSQRFADGISIYKINIINWTRTASPEAIMELRGFPQPPSAQTSPVGPAVYIDGSGALLLGFVLLLTCLGLAAVGRSLLATARNLTEPIDEASAHRAQAFLVAGAVVNACLMILMTSYVVGDAI